jgi:hypothetical protein
MEAHSCRSRTIRTRAIEPIRDIAAVWDVEVLSAFLERDDLSELIRRSLAH